MKTRGLLTLITLALLISACGGAANEQVPVQAAQYGSMTGTVAKAEKIGDGVWTSVRMNVQLHVTESASFPELTGKNVIVVLQSEALALNIGDTISLENCEKVENEYKYCDLSPVVTPAE